MSDTRYQSLVSLKEQGCNNKLCASFQAVLRHTSPVKVKVKPNNTHGFFADDHLLDLHDLCDVVSGWFERCLTHAVIDTYKHLSTDVIASVNTCST